jgi:hypothetical protein
MDTSDGGIEPAAAFVGLDAQGLDDPPRATRWRSGWREGNSSRRSQLGARAGGRDPAVALPSAPGIGARWPARRDRGQRAALRLA